MTLSLWCWYLSVTVIVFSIPSCLTSNLKQLTLGGNSGKFHRVVVHPENGVVYVGATNAIYQLTSSLSPLEKTRSGPVMDDIRCPPVPLPCEDHNRTLQDNEIKILEIDPITKVLLQCGSVSQGICSLHDLSNVSHVHSLPSNLLTNYVAGKGSAVAFFAPASYSSTGQVLYSAAAFDGRPEVYTPPTVSSRKLSIDGGKYSFDYAKDTPTVKSFLDIRTKYREKYQIQYLYGFSHEGFSYFLQIQRINITSDIYESRLARICQDDQYYFSYTEVPLECNHIGIDYQIAQSAYFDNEDDNAMLTIAFGKSNKGSSTPVPEHGTAVCVYTMSDIREKFRVAAQNCYMGQGTLMQWFLGTVVRCNKAGNIRIDDDFCGGGLNNAIEGLEMISALPMAVLNETITALATARQGGTFVGFLGTSSGEVLKVFLDDYKEGQPAILRYDIGTGHQIEPSLARDPTGSHLYLLSNDKVVKFPMFTCEFYTDCSRCVTTPDPLGCGWCGDHCSREKQCQTNVWTRSCPPIINSVFPLSGPVQGGTLLEIQGNNFGSSDAGLISVELSTSACIVNKWNMTVIWCRTSKSEVELSTRVAVEVHDKTLKSAHYRISGVATSDHLFRYAIPEMTAFSPLQGPLSGETNITIVGENLDIGRTHFVKIAGSDCSIYRLSSTMVQCSTSKKAVPKASLLRMAIDGAVLLSEQKFKYMEDPVIGEISPKTSFVKGGVPITVTGSRLNVVADPRMKMKVGRFTFISSCTPNINGSEMVCPAPDITDVSVIATRDLPFQTYMFFIMDGVADNFSIEASSARWFLYYPNPDFFPFPDGHKEVSLISNDGNMQLEGNNLDLGYEMDQLHITIGELGECNVTKVMEKVVYCMPPVLGGVNPSDTFHVQVKVGNLVFLDLGTISFLKVEQLRASGHGADGGSWAWIMAALVVIVIVALLGVMLYMKKKHKGPFHRPPINQPNVRYTTASRMADQEYQLANTSRQYLRNVYDSVPEQRRDAQGACSAESDEEMWLLLQDQNIVIDRQFLKLDYVIGQGHFGCVYRGLLLDKAEEQREVAVKTLNNPMSDVDDSVTAFLREGLMMKDFRHENVLTLIGVCVPQENEGPMVVLPFMKHGDLLSYLRHSDNNPTVRDLLTFAIQIGAGMAYLADLKFVHRDLAARNCMLDEHLVVKVADFGLSRDIYERDYYSAKDKNAKLPVKWMAIESLEKGTYNSKTDVWSYGVVLWELMTRGVCPYPDVDNWDILAYLKCGRRMPKPNDYCPSIVYNIMLRCWSVNANDRPSFHDMVAEIESFLERAGHQQRPDPSSVQYINIQQTESSGGSLERPDDEASTPV